MSDHEVRVRTNNVPRFLVDGFELSAAERAEFDYHDWEAIEEGRDSATFFRYRGDLHDLGNFERTDGIPGWDGLSADSFSSGTVVRLVDNERVIVGYYTVR